MNLNQLQPIALFSISIFILIISILIHDPVLLKIRFIGLIGINFIGITWLCYGYFQFKKYNLFHKISVFLVLIGILISLGKEASFQYKKSFVHNYNKDKLSYYAKHVIVGFRSRTELKELLQLPVIGFFITHHNVKDLTKEETINLISEIQLQRTKNDFSKALIATDQEGGKVSRLSPPLKQQISLGELVEESKNENKEVLENKINSFASEQAEELQSIGVNVNFSPIVDLKFDKEASLLDFYSRIYNRSISKDPELVAFVAEVYSKKLLAYGILPTLKHFPGLGRVAEDTHFFNASLDTPLNELEKSDLVPFKQIVHKIDYPIIMLSHSTITNLDSTTPISISEQGIQGYIRKNFPTTTVLISDDMNMGPTMYFSGGIGNAAVTGLNAGLDILLVSYDGEQVYEVIYSLIQADQNQKLNRERLGESEKRIHRLIQYITERP